MEPHVFHTAGRRTDYEWDILDWLKQTEKSRAYIEIDSVHHQARDYFVNVIRRVGNHFGINSTTIHLAVFYLDNFMDGHSIEAKRYNLVAVTCLLVACKLEENYKTVPRIKEINKLLDKQYHINDYNLVEAMLLKYLGFRLTVPTAATFAEHFLLYITCKSDFSYGITDMEYVAKRVQATELTFEYLDIVLMEVPLVNVMPSLAAAGCIAASRKIVIRTKYWNARLEQLTGYSQKEVDPICRFLTGKRIDATVMSTSSSSSWPYDSGYLSLNESISLGCDAGTHE